jgi:LCP family protein required for cell wall assembly
MRRVRGLILLFIIGALGMAAGIYAAKLAIPFKDERGLVGFFDSYVNPKNQFVKHQFLVLVLGKDYNYTNKGIRYTSNSRTDTIMLMSIDIDKKTLSAVSIPRDTKIEADDGVSGKINAVYSRGGLKLLETTLENKFGIEIDHHVVLKPDAVKEIVDAVGGVNVEPIDRMNYDDTWAHLHIHFEPGSQKITGEQAVGYVRFRETGNFEIDANGEQRRIQGSHRSKEEGDLRRTARQQEVLHALIREGKSLRNIGRIGDIINVGFQQVDTSLKKTQLVALGQIFKEAMGEMHSSTLPGGDETTDAYYYVLDNDRAQKMVDWLLKGDEAAGLSLVRVAVSNGTKTSGAAKNTAELIQSRLGYDAWHRNPPAKPAEKTEVVYSKAAFEDAALKIKELIGAAAIRKDPSIDSPEKPEITIVIGTDIAEKMIPTNPDIKKPIVR